MATSEELRTLLDESRNGCNDYIRHPLARRFIYTDGIKAVADLCGAYWLLDIIGTEGVEALLKHYHDTYDGSALVEVDVNGFGDERHGQIDLTVADDTPPIWSMHLTYTDFPEGHWVFKLGVDTLIDKGRLACVMCLLSED